ncbi:MAG: type II secretion system protein [Acidobacteria bacterium]|nr:type II secretion system protein [Acidobacteriota bacterium]
MTARHAQGERGSGRRRPGERGYALIALLASMTLLMIAMMAAAPSIRQQSRRELELEAIARGEEVAEAIRAYVSMNPTHQPPNSMDELLEGVTPAGRTKKVKVLRASAARDPLSESGEWRTVKPRDEAMVRFIRDITEYADGKTPAPTGNPPDPSLQPLAAQLPQLTGLVTGLGSGSDDGGEDNSLSTSGPFVGVTSRSRRDSIITYYGIDRHDRWVFTPFYR